MDNKIKKFISLVEVPDEFGIDDNVGVIMGEEEVRNILNEVDVFATIKSGSTKMVICFDNFDKVIKIPFNGMIREDTYEFQYFYGADAENESDYCEAEVIAYENAKLVGAECFFAETSKYSKTSNGTGIYLQEKVKEWGFCNQTPSHEGKKFAAGIYDTELDKDWLALAYDWYGKEKVFNLINFIDEYGITDLHHSNIGIRMDGSPVILDYSSYNS